jgi:L-alanine-DL-glutamate epimerase-like enolase superfamily enzyme
MAISSGVGRRRGARELGNGGRAGYQAHDARIFVNGTTVRRLGADRLDLALREPFGIASGAQDVARNVLVTVELADGTLGYGEAAPFPAYNGETQEAAARGVERARALVEGEDVRSWRAIARALGEPLEGAASARCAIEAALLDALTKRARMPLWAFFGGASTSLETDLTITTGSVEHARAAAADLAARGFRTAKIKVGGVSVAEDVARVVAAHRAAPACALVLDANASLVAADAIALVAALRSAGVAIALFEQPVAKGDLAGLAAVGAHAGVLVAADESAVTAADGLRLAASRAAGVVNVKLMKAGIAEALDLAAVARAAGLGLMIGGMVESTLAMTVSACFAAGLGGFSFVDLDTPFFLESEPFEGGFVTTGPHLDLSGVTVGHGVRPR